VGGGTGRGARKMVKMAKRCRGRGALFQPYWLGIGNMYVCACGCCKLQEIKALVAAVATKNGGALYEYL